MTVNEGRAIMNYPKLDSPGADDIVTPLNVLMGAQASPNDTDPTKNRHQIIYAKQEDPVYIAGTDPIMFEVHKMKWLETYVNHYKRQERAIMSTLPGIIDNIQGDSWWDADRWNKELRDDLIRLNLFSAAAFASRITNTFGVEFRQDPMMAWIEQHSNVQAQGINEYLYQQLTQAMEKEDPLEKVKMVFTIAVGVWAISNAISSLTSISNFGSLQGAYASKLKSKTWVTNSKNPRDIHLKLDGETVGIGDTFSNGMRFPGAPEGGAENNSNCQCSIRYNR